jgi:hypothetical protein|nr:MAG TPA: Cell wall hydrolase autolysin [Caudoviricetes sp.]
MATTGYNELLKTQEKNKPFNSKFYEELEKLSYQTDNDKNRQQRKIILSAGHSTKFGEDRGAFGNNFVEGIENAKIRKRVYEILKNKYNTEVIIDGDETILRASMNYFTNLIRTKKYADKDVIALEIHFNASPNPTANGTETVIPAEHTKFECELANEISRGISGLLNTRLRGEVDGLTGVITEASSRAKRLGWMRIPAQNVLLETCFISNTKEMEAYVKNFEPICQTLAAILYHNSII